MSKEKLLLDVIESVRTLADTLQALVDGITENESTVIAESIAPAKAEKPKTKEVKLEDVRAALADKSRSGKTAEVKALITSFGADKLSDIDSSNYAELMKKAEVL